MIRSLKFFSLVLFLFVCIATVNASLPQQKPEIPAEDDSTDQSTFHYLSTKLRAGIFADRIRRDARYGQRGPAADHRVLNLERRQPNPSSNSSITSTSSSPPQSTVPSTSPSSSLPTQTTATPKTSTPASSSPEPSSSTVVSITTLSDGSLSTFTSVVVVYPTRTTGVTGKASPSGAPTLQGGAAAATIDLKKHMLAMLGGAVAVAMVL